MIDINGTCKRAVGKRARRATSLAPPRAHLVQDRLGPQAVDLEVEPSPLGAIRIFLSVRHKLDLDLLVWSQAEVGKVVEVGFGEVGAVAFEEGAFFGLEAERSEVCMPHSSYQRLSERTEPPRLRVNGVKRDSRLIAARTASYIGRVNLVPLRFVKRYLTFTPGYASRTAYCLLTRDRLDERISLWATTGRAGGLYAHGQLVQVDIEQALDVALWRRRGVGHCSRREFRRR